MSRCENVGRSGEDDRRDIFDKEARRKPLAVAADAGCYGVRIDFRLEVIVGTGVARGTRY